MIEQLNICFSRNIQYKTATHIIYRMYIIVMHNQARFLSLQSPQLNLNSISLTVNWYKNSEDSKQIHLVIIRLVILSFVLLFYIAVRIIKILM